MKLKKEGLKIVCGMIIIMNLLSAVSGVLYYILATTSMLWLWNLAGVLWLITWILNILLIYYNRTFIAKLSKIEIMINRFSYFALIFIIFSMAVLIFYSMALSYLSSTSFFFLFLVFFVLIGMAVFGILLAFFDFMYLNKRGLFNFE